MFEKNEIMWVGQIDIKDKTHKKPQILKYQTVPNMREIIILIENKLFKREMRSFYENHFNTAN